MEEGESRAWIRFYRDFRRFDFEKYSENKSFANPDRKNEFKPMTSPLSQAFPDKTVTPPVLKLNVMRAPEMASIFDI